RGRHARGLDRRTSGRGGGRESGRRSRVAAAVVPAVAPSGRPPSSTARAEAGAGRLGVVQGAAVPAVGARLPHGPRGVRTAVPVADDGEASRGEGRVPAVDRGLPRVG